MLLPYLWESTAAFSYSTTEVDGDLFKNVSEKKTKDVKWLSTAHSVIFAIFLMPKSSM